MNPEIDEIPEPAEILPKDEPKKGRKKKLIIAVVLLLIGGAAAFWLVASGSDKESSSDSSSGRTETSEVPESDDGTLRLIATGDMIAHDSINDNAKQTDGAYDYLSLMSDMKPFFDKADLKFCNQATPAGGEAFGITGYPVFNAPLSFTSDLVRLGCNVVNIGTNHTNDKGQKLIDAVVTDWDKQKDVLAFAGANRSSEEQARLRTFEKQGVKFAFLSYTTYSNAKPANSYGLNMYDKSKAKAQLQAARKAADIVIVSMRWGTEYSSEVNFQQSQIAQNLADFGADVVFGHGPHVLQPVKRIQADDGRQALIWFSLGNFLNSQLDIESLTNGIAIMDIDTDKKEITDVSFMPVYQHYEWTAAEKKREDLLARNNFKLLPLDLASDLLSKSLHGTTVAAQTERIKSLLNSSITVPIITSAKY